MTGIIPWISAAVLFLLLFIVLLLLGIIRKKVNLVIGAVACFLLFGVAGGVAAYQTLRRTIRLASDIGTRRDGIQIYSDILGAPVNDCVKIYASSDPIIPTIDDPVSACFSTCPAEVRRVLAAKSFEIVKRPTADIAFDAEQCCDNYFSYARFGDTLLECITTDADNHASTVWISTDSAHGFLQKY